MPNGEVLYLTGNDWDLFLSHLRPEWLRWAVELIEALGARPSEVVGCRGRARRDQRNFPGLYGRDVLPDRRVRIYGKNSAVKIADDPNGFKIRYATVARNSVWERLEPYRLRPDEKVVRAPPYRGKPGMCYYPSFEKALWIARKDMPDHLRNVSARWLRHGHAIRALDAGINIEALRRQLGHEYLSTTQRYLRFLPDDSEGYAHTYDEKTTV